MGRTMVNTLESEDYIEIEAGVQVALQGIEWFRRNGVEILLGHDNRYWEYGTAIQLLLFLYGEDKIADLDILDVGTGPGGLGPTLALIYNASVTECEPDVQWAQARESINDLLTKWERRPLNVLNVGFDGLPDKQYDVVYCISVLEHVKEEKQAWEQLAKRVKPGGLLFLTTDCVEKHEEAYKFDDYRENKFTPQDLEKRIIMLQELGFNTVGLPDYQWHGAQVFDYTFFRAALIRSMR